MKDPGPGAILAPDELAGLFEVSKTCARDEAIFRLGFVYALRASEVGRLRVGDVDFKTRTLTVRRLNQKSALYPLPPSVSKLPHLRADKGRLKEPLFATERGTAISRRTVDWLMKKYCTEAGIPRLKQHFGILRRTFITNLLSVGQSPIAIQQFVGHQHISTTVRYYQHVWPYNVSDLDDLVVLACRASSVP